MIDVEHSWTLSQSHKVLRGHLAGILSLVGEAGSHDVFAALTFFGIVG